MLDEQGSNVNFVPYISLGDEIVIERLTGRRTDTRTGRSYHLKYDPPPDDAELEQRPDDKKETVQVRIDEFYNNTAPLLEHYNEQGVLYKFDGELGINELANAIMIAIGEQAFA
jgi:adenylate kinase